MHLSPLSFAFTFILYSVALLSSAVPFDDESGVLYRFSPVSENEIEELLSWAGLREWDVWQTSHSHVDVYFPRRVIAETELGHVPFHLPPGISHRIDGWNHDASSYTHAHAPSPPASAPAVPVAATDNAGEIRRHWDVVSPSNATFHGQYHPLEEIESFVRDLAAAYPRQLSVVRLGHSGEGREMFALEISSDTLGGGVGGGGHVSHDSNPQIVLGKKKGKPISSDPCCGFLITGAQHAREWVASASALYIAHALLADPSEAFSLAHLLERHNFYIVPVPNPDGYVYTWEHDRFWYKNRLQHDPEARCVGVDMNRNWGYKWTWNKSGSNNPCSDWYPGDRPFQAPEVNNMENYFSRLPRLKGFLDLRSYGQMLSTPFSYSCRRSPKDAEDQLEAISGAAFAMKKLHGMHFTTGALCSTLYRAPGNIIDWVYKKMGVKYSFAAHLRDTGTYGFALPEQWIRPVGEETAKMVEYLANFIADKECH